MIYKQNRSEELRETKTGGWGKRKSVFYFGFLPKRMTLSPFFSSTMEGIEFGDSCMN